MQSCFALAAFIGALASGVDAQLRFGPNECVTLSRSSEGSCVITTACEVDDISQTEFAFDCVGEGIMRHSFGVGNFDSTEEFDTGVKCARCTTPSPVPASPDFVSMAALNRKPLSEAQVHAAPAPAAAAEEEASPASKEAASRASEETDSSSEEEEDADDDSKEQHTSKSKEVQMEEVHEVKEGGHASKSKDSAFINPFSGKPWIAEPAHAGTVKYGPGGCVSIYKKEDHCIMETACKNEDMSEYEYGLVCVGEHGTPVKHLFGEDSFEKEETFDTLIKCKQCLGLEVLPNNVNLAGEVSVMAKDLKNLKDVMKNITLNVEMIAEVVMPDSAGAPAPAAAGSPAAFLHADHRHMKKRHLRHGHHHRRYEEDE